LFRGLNDIGLGTPVGVRLLAVVFALVGAIACGSIAGTLFGARSRGWAALVVAVLTSVPQYEGFLANGELLSGAVGAVALAVMLRSWWDRDEVSQRGLFAAGILAALAFGLKQSAFDAAAAGVVMLLVASAFGDRNRRADRLRGLLSVAAGVAVPLGLMMIHGAVVGWHNFFYAVAGYRRTTRNAIARTDWHELAKTAKVAMPVVVVVLVVIGLAMYLSRGRHYRRPIALVAVWIVLALAAFGLGGLFHLHYWVILMFPLGTACGGLIGSVEDRRLASSALCLALLVPVMYLAVAVTIPRAQVGKRLDDDPRLIVNEHVADWFRANRRPGDVIYALCASAGLYGNIDTDPPYPYLWYYGVTDIPDARPRLKAMFTGPNPPRFVAAFQSAGGCDPSGVVGSALDARYRRATTIDGIPIFELNDPTAA
jgi:4-amino-4-deoxy-L-arabinose transferase-like glycosyltransferase